MPVVGSFLYASSGTLKEILQDKYAVLSLEDPVFSDIMPIASQNTDRVLWDQRDSFRGLAGARAPGGPYTVVAREGINRYEMRPGYYGDEKIMDEQMLTQAAQVGTFGDAIDVTGLQGNDQDHLMTRALQRLKKVAWDFCTLGSYTYFDANGVLSAEDAASLTPFTTAVAWSDHANSTPLYDLRQAKLRHRGHSVSFGRDAKLYLNSTDVNNLLANANQNDLGARRFIQVAPSTALTAPLTLGDVNSYLFSADLPQVVEWDDNYIDDAGAVQLYIATGYGTLVGKRLRGEPVSEFIMTRNPELMMAGVAGRNAMPSRGPMGPFDNLFYDFEWQHKPLRGISAMGFNGAPAIYYPSAVIPFRPSGGGSDT